MNKTAAMNITMGGRTHDDPPVEEMVVIHRIFRREFRLLADLVRLVPAGDVRRPPPSRSTSISP